MIGGRHLQRIDGWRGIAEVGGAGGLRRRRADRGQRLRLWKRGGRAERLAAAGGHRCCRIGLIGGQGETRSYEIVSPSRPRGRRTLPVAVAVAVAVAEAKKESWAQNCEGSKQEREDKL